MLHTIWERDCRMPQEKPVATPVTTGRTASGQRSEQVCVQRQPITGQYSEKGKTHRKRQNTGFAPAETWHAVDSA